MGKIVDQSIVKPELMLLIGKNNVDNKIVAEHYIIFISTVKSCSWASVYKLKARI